MSDPMGDCDEDAREHALLMSTLVHDLRNPLASILSGLNLLRRGQHLDHRDNVLIKRLHASAWRMFACHNTGAPIAPKLFPQLFDPFTRGTSSAGFGLGLYIVARIVKGHGGRIRVSSTFDEGTTLTIRLPRSSFISRYRM